VTTFTGHLTEEQAQRLVDGSLDRARDSGVEAHAAGCAACLALVASYRALASALEDLEIPPLPDDFTGAVLARVEAMEKTAARERRLALGILLAVVAATATVFGLAGARAWASPLARLAEGIGSAARVLRIGAGFLPELISALRLQIALAASALALPLLFALARLMPPHRREVA
jgi:anti-sigma factor RsiW